MDSEQLDKHLRETPWFIEQHRARIKPNDYTYSDEEAQFGSFGPKSPCSDNFIMLADREAASIGSMARYCMNVGSIRPFPLRGFWWTRGICRGMKSSGLPEIRETTARLRHVIGDILNTEGIDNHLYGMEEIRAVSLKAFPNENEDWLTMEETMDYTGRKRAIIYEWISAGDLPTLDDRWGLMISKPHLQMKMAIVHANLLRSIGNARKSNSKHS